MSSIFLPFSDDNKTGVRIAFDDGSTGYTGGRLAEILSLPLEAGCDGDVLYTGECLTGVSILREIYADFDVLEFPRQIVISRVTPEKTVRRNRQLVLRQLLPCAMQMGRKKGLDAALLHGAILTLDQSEKDCILVFGVSGMGKSTLAARWENSGGKAPADDMIMVFRRGDGEFFARPLPTWSRYPKPADLKKSFRIKKVLRLQRGERDEILPSPNPISWVVDCNKALMFHHYFPVLKRECVRSVASECMDFCGQLHKHFGTSDICSTLDGELDMASMCGDQSPEQFI